MRIPEKPPSLASFLSGKSPEEVTAAVMAAVRLEGNQVIRMANDHYLHWDRFRFKKFPSGLTPELAWAVVQFSRGSQFQEIPLRSYDGKSQLKYWVPPQHQEWLSIIDQQAGGLIGGRNAHGIPDDNEMYLFNSLMEEAIASSQIEGACTTRKAGKELLRTGREPQDRAEQMILNNYKAILEIRDLKKEDLTPALLFHLQKVLTDKTLEKPDMVGRYRRADEYVYVADARTSEEIYVPPSADTIEDRIKEVCDFANTRSSPFIHPVVKAMALHFAIGFIHPFVDGNGRTARALFYWYMLKSGYWLFEYLPISRIIVAAPVKYARAYLYTETDGGDLTYFNQYHLSVVIRAIGELHEYFNSLQKLLAEAEQLLADYPQLNHRQRSLVSHVLKHPDEMYSIKEYAGKYLVTYNTARADVLGLEKLGFFKKAKRPAGGKEWTFRPADDLIKLLKRRGLPKQLGQGREKKNDKQQSGHRDDSSTTASSLFD